MIIAILLTNSSVAFAFNDVPSNAYYKEAVDYLLSEKIITNRAEFNPHGKATKLTYFKILFDVADVTLTKEDYGFGTDKWYAAYLNTAVKYKLFEKDEDFRGVVTRRWALSTAAKLNGLNLVNISNENIHIDFRDVRGSSLDIPYAKWAVKNNLLHSLSGEGSFYANKSINRAEAAYLIYQVDQTSILDITRLPSRSVESVNKPIEEPKVIQRQPTITINRGVPAQSELDDLPLSDIFLDVVTRLEQDYHAAGIEEVDMETMMREAIMGYVNASNDPYTTFTGPADSSFVNTLTQTDFEGVGMTIQAEANGDVVISSFLSDSPAERAGLQSGDIIKKVNGASTAGLNESGVANLIKGPAGTKVVIEVYRKTQNRNISYNVIRQKIELSYVAMDSIGMDTLYIDVNLFNRNVAETVERAIDEAMSANRAIDELILDVRNNPGGFLDEALDIMDLFTEDNEILLLEKKKNNIEKIERAKRDKVFDLELVILVNESSASASEILAATLRETNDAYVIGATTFGKGTVQQLIQYKDGSYLKYTIAEWLSPSGKQINNVGVVPDLRVTSDDNSISDKALNAAINYLR